MRKKAGVQPPATDVGGHRYAPLLVPKFADGVMQEGVSISIIKKAGGEPPAFAVPHTPIRVPRGRNPWERASGLAPSPAAGFRGGPQKKPTLLGL